jgi:Ca2+-transporting ATPase
MTSKKHFEGLSDAQVLDSRRKYGENILTPPAKTPLWKLFLEKFEDPIIRILLIAAFLSLGIAIINHINTGIGEYAETIGIFCAIFLSIGVAFWFELDANRKFDILNLVNDDTLVKVVRNGNVCEIPKRDVVVGDIIMLETGEEIPADGELLEAISMQVDESCLTGEPMIDKTTCSEDFDKESTYPSNWVMRGTKVMDGHGIVEVKRVGDNTEYGKVAEKATEMSGEETPLNKQLDVLAKFIGVVGLALAALTFTVLFVKDIFFGSVTYSLGQLGLLAAVITGALIALTKVWLPIIYDAFELCGKEKELPKSVDEGGWLRWIITGLLAFIVIACAGFAFKVNPLQIESWVSMETARHILQYFMVAVTLVVVAVPEGLPMSVTLSLALSMRRMLKTNNLVRKMHACETMGATTVICTDKTGTLTQNQMQVYQTDFFGLNNQEITDGEAGKLVRESIAVNSTAFLDFSNPEKVKILGNPTEGALLLWLYNNKVNYLPVREETAVIEQLTFSTERKYMATLVESPSLGKKILYVKGAPEIVLAKSDTIYSPGKVEDIAGKKESIEAQLLQYQNQAMRTLGFAYQIVDRNIDIQNISGLTFLGIAAISDPVRVDVPAAVSKCLNAGIKVKIVTGDTPGTAMEIGRQIGIWNESDKRHNIITGPEFGQLTDEEAEQRVKSLKIMCRARPTDKQRLVQILQKAGAVVAVTGDGTNDAPALNYAHVGLSMGSGTSVAKEASDITLLDDSFNSISTAVMWGRSLYQNIQRFILFQLTINVAALVIVFFGTLLGFELPLTVTQMLWVNLIMDTFAAGALASLPPNENVMKNKPRRNSDFIISPAMRFNILFVGLTFVALLLGLLYYFSTDGNISAYDLSRFFTIFVMLQFWNMFNAKAFLTGKSAFAGLSKSLGFIIVAVVILIGQILIVEFGGEVFRTVPLTIKDWLIIIGSTSLVFWIGEVVRLIRK